MSVLLNVPFSFSYFLHQLGRFLFPKTGKGAFQAFLFLTILTEIFLFT